MHSSSERRWACALALGLVLCACSGSERSSSDDDDGGTTSGSGGATSNGPIASASTGGAGQGGGGPGSGVGGGAAADSLYPLAVGNRWTYEVVPVGSGSICASGLHDAEVLGSTVVDGRDAFEVSNWCTGVPGTNLLAEGPGEEVHFYYQGSWLRVIAEPIQEGASWDYFNTSYTWQDAGTVTVAAGTFPNCWTAVQNVSYVAYQTYCRGVGMVRSYSQDLAGNGWDAQLVDAQL